MGTSYGQINRVERIQLESLLRAGHTQGEIGRQLGRPSCTIGREIKRNRSKKDKRYLPGRAERLRLDRRAKINQRGRVLIPGTPLTKTVERWLKRYWSPEQISGRLRLESGGTMQVSHETIYRFIDEKRPDLKKYLRSKKGSYRKRYGTNIREKRREEAKKKRIDVRPKIVEKRSRIGDWEGDTIVGAERTTHIVTHVERKSGLLAADKVDEATAEAVRKITTKRFNGFARKKCLTITYDNGVQFNEHEKLEQDLNIQIYFAHPYHSWERGTNENSNGLLRQFFPKGTLFKPVTKQNLERKVKLINTRPRKRHGYRTPEEIFFNRPTRCTLG